MNENEMEFELERAEFNANMLIGNYQEAAEILRGCYILCSYPDGVVTQPPLELISMYLKGVPLKDVTDDLFAGTLRLLVNTFANRLQ